MKAMVLAAGRGERMRPLSDVTPKPLLQVAGKSLIQHHLDALAAAGIHEVVINLAWHGAQIRNALGDGSQFGMSITYSDEGDHALETGGGIHRALPALGERFLVISADIWTDYPLSQCLNRPDEGDVAHFVVVPNPDYHPRGDFGLRAGRMTQQAELLTYANVGCFRAEFFAACTPGRFPLAPLMFDWIRAGRVSGELYSGAWCNVGTPAQLAALDQQLQSVSSMAEQSQPA
jgi:N-acetyl-alpha-D-muramate 1-phosphate uridylyltransferase